MEGILGAPELVFNDVTVHVGLVDVARRPMVMVGNQNGFGEAPQSGFRLVAVQLKRHGGSAVLRIETEPEQLGAHV